MTHGHTGWLQISRSGLQFRVDEGLSDLLLKLEYIPSRVVPRVAASWGASKHRLLGKGEYHANFEIGRSVVTAVRFCV